MRDKQTERRRRPVAIAVAVEAAGEYAEREVSCTGCGNVVQLGAAWIIPQGFVICSGCAAPVLRADLERRLELIQVQDARGKLRAVALPAGKAAV